MEGCLEDALMNTVMPFKVAQMNDCKASGECPARIKSTGPIACDAKSEMAGQFPCRHIDLASFTSLSELGSAGNGELLAPPRRS